MVYLYFYLGFKKYLLIYFWSRWVLAEACGLFLSDWTAREVSIHLSVDGHQRLFYPLAIVNSAALRHGLADTSQPTFLLPGVIQGKGRD